MSVKILSYNLNGIRAALNKDLIQWLASEDYDIINFQETKAQPDQIEHNVFEDLGYKYHYWHSAEKKGYSGVATYSRIKPDNVISGFQMPVYDSEGRILRLDYGDWTLLNCYFPSGTTGDIRQTLKMEFLDDFYNWINKLKKERPQLIVVGDYNIAHTENDIHNPVGNKKSSGFLPEEREWMTKWFNNGFVDSFRHLHPEKTEYSWWSFRFNSRAQNKGWRIDYQSVTENLKDKILAAGHHNEAFHSDHCPVFLEMDL